MYEINREKQFELLRWLFVNLDSQWLAKTAGVIGPANASKLNDRIQSGLGKTGMKAMLALLGKNRASNLEDAAGIVLTYLAIIYGDRSFSGSFGRVNSPTPGQEQLDIQVTRFTALEPIKKIARAAGEKPGLASDTLWSSWFEVLLPEDQVEVLTTSHENGPDLVRVTVSSDRFLPEVEEDSPIAALLQIPLSLGGAQTPENKGEKEPGSPPPVPRMVGMDERPAGTPPPASFSKEEIQTEAAALKGGISTPGPAVPPANLRVDPTTGRPLFSGDPEEEVRRNVERAKAAKNLPLISRLILSREAKDILKQSAGQTPTSSFSMAAGIELILQRNLAEEKKRNPGLISGEVHIMEDEAGDLLIQVGPDSFGSVSEMPAGRIREILQLAVDEWAANRGL